MDALARGPEGWTEAEKEELDEELAIDERPDGEVVVSDAELGDWSTNPGYRQEIESPRDEDETTDRS
ncbi:MAG: hypothetical protein ACRDIB_13230 [Ardenticatenaceae bacterium]